MHDVAEGNVFVREIPRAAPDAVRLQTPWEYSRGKADVSTRDAKFRRGLFRGAALSTSWNPARGAFNPPGGTVGFGVKIGAIPEPNGSDNGFAVTTPPAVGWQRVEVLCVSTADNSVRRPKNILQEKHRVIYGFLPAGVSIFAPRLFGQTRHEGVPFAERDEAEFHRHDHIIRDERCPDTGPEADEEHSAAFVIRERLHGGVVHDANGTTEGA